MTEKKRSRPHEKEGGCCWGMSIRIKAYIILAIGFAATILVIIYSDMIPLLTLRDLEEKQVQINMLTMGSDLSYDFLSFKDLAEATLRDLVNKIMGERLFLNMTKLTDYVSSYFQKNGEWNAETYKNGFAFYNAQMTVMMSEFHLLDETTFRVNMTARELPMKFQGLTNFSKGFLSRILKPNETWSGLADRHELIYGYVPFYMIVAAPVIIPETGALFGWLALFQDERLSVMKTLNKLKFCAGDVPGNAVYIKGPMPRDFEMYAVGLRGIKTGFFTSFDDTDGTYRFLIHSKAETIHEGHSACYDNDHKIYEGDQFFGTTYFAIRDMSQNDPYQLLTYLRIDSKLEIMNDTISYIIYAVVVPSCAFVALLVIVVIIYVEVGVMSRLDAAKKSLHQIVLERKAILERYIEDDRLARNYYNFSGEKGKENDELNELLERIAQDASGGGDELGLLMHMSKSVGEWMDHILQDKLKRLEIARKENKYYYDALTLLNAWSRRSDVRFSPSYVAVDTGLGENSDLRTNFVAFTKTMDLNRILKNAVALEMFKSYCKAAGHEASLYFVLDVAWLNMMESALHSKDDGDSSFTDTSGSVSSAHGNVSHSQIVRLVQTIFSTYIYSPDHPVEPIGLSPAAIKRLTVRADAKGRIKYSKGLFKSVASDVRHYIDAEILPAFKRSAHFRALFVMLNATSQVDFSSSNETVVYACPIVHSDSVVVSKKEDDDNGNESDDEGKIKVDDFVTRLPLGVLTSGAIDTLVEEEKNFDGEDIRTLAVTATSAQITSNSSIPSSNPSRNTSRSKIQAVSPFAALLPGKKKSPSPEDDKNSEASDGKKDTDWMMKSFSQTRKRDDDESHDKE